MSDLKSHHITWRTLTPRIVMLGIAVLAIPATVSNLDAAHCGQASELSAARLRWAATRQTHVGPGQADKICRAYGQQFYEAVEARQAASVCQDSVNRQRDVDILDAEIDAFNNLIAAQCSGS
jgi:4-hydroxy-3-methylbut-2-enyl diphosphate reductase IspH